MIRWSVQKGYITIPKTSKPDRVVLNNRVFDWTISPQDIEIMVHGYFIHYLHQK